MKKEINRGAISIFALLSMMFFLIFIMVAYNNVMQKSKTQVETEEILSDYYKPVQTAAEIMTSKNFENSVKLADLRNREQKLEVLKSGNNGKYIYSSGHYYKIDNTNKEYQQVQYIRSSGTQFIDTDVKGNNNSLSFEIQYEIIEFPIDKEYAYIFGSYQSEEHITTRIILNGYNSAIII